jgi:DNA-binding MarR family transcriptional regulator
MSKGNRESLEAQAVLEIRRHQNGVDAVDEAAAERLGLNRTDMRCLDIVEQNGAITAGQLAAAMGLSPGAVTTMLDRMEAVGYLRRVRDQDDRRKIMVELTPLAQARTWEIYGPLAKWGTSELGRLSETQLSFLLDFMRKGAVFLHEYAAKLRALPAPAARKTRAPK